MDEAARLILLLALAGGAITLLGGAFVWFLDEGRRIRRSLKKMLGAEPQALLIARGRGKGVGFDFSMGQVAVTWDCGGWCLLYRLDELMGAELVIDGQVAARAHRGEARRALDHMTGALDEVRLRFVFDDPAYPDFDLVLWTAADLGRRKAPTAAEAVQEANRWIARMESVLRRPVARRASPAVAATSPPAPVAPPAQQPAFAPSEEVPPWEDAADDGDVDDDFDGPRRALS